MTSPIPTTTTTSTPTTIIARLKQIAQSPPPHSFLLSAFVLALLPAPFGFWGLLTWLVAAYLLWPPAIGRWQSFAALAFAAWGALQAFLPTFGHPLWRAAFKGVAELPGTLSAQPLVSLCHWSYLWVGVMAALWFWCRNFSGDYLKRLCRRLAVAGIIMCSIAAVCLYSRTSSFLYPDLDFFSYFANRNQSATLYAIFATIGLGLFVLEQRRTWRKVGVLCLVVAIAAVALSPSRGGWISLGAGVIALLATTRGRYLWLSLAIVAAAAAILAGPVALDQTHKSLGADAADIRAVFYRNATTMVAQNPLGTGLGTIEYIFPHYQKTTPFDQVAQHPESDWFWLLGELGFPAAIFILAVFLSMRWDTTQRRTRISRAVIWVVFVASLIDVPGHRFGLWVPLLILSGGIFALRPTSRPALPPMIFSLLCLGILAVSFIPSATYGRLLERFEAALEAKSLYWTRITYGPLDKQIPLDYTHRLRMAQAELRWEGSPDQATKLYRQVLVAQPCFPKLAYDCGFELRAYDFARASAFWREALRRTKPEERARVYKDILRQSTPTDVASLISLNGRDLSLWTVYLGYNQFPAAYAKAVQAVDLTQAADAPKLLMPWVSNPTSAADALAYLKSQNAFPMLQAVCLASMGNTQQAVAFALASSPPEPLKDNYTSLTLEELRLQIKLLPEFSPRYKEAIAARALAAHDESTYIETLTDLARKPLLARNATLTLAQTLAARQEWPAAWKLIRSTMDEDKKP